MNLDTLYGTDTSMAYNAVLSVEFVNEWIEEPVSLEEAKLWLRIDIDEDDALTTSLITAARIVCEKYVNLSFIPRTVTAIIVTPNGYMRLPYTPLVSVTSVKDQDGAVIDYTSNMLGIRANTSAPYVVEYLAGYQILPEDLKEAIKAQMLFMNENRGDNVKISPAAKEILYPLMLK